VQFKKKDFQEFTSVDGAQDHREPMAPQLVDEVCWDWVRRSLAASAERALRPRGTAVDPGGAAALTRNEKGARARRVPRAADSSAGSPFRLQRAA